MPPNKGEAKSLLKEDKNDPGRFLGEGVSFRAKLIGVLEVPEARGDRMCQEALADLKMAIRAAGEHKQRIQVHVAIDGLRLRDDKTGDSLYHHPVHKISFIAQDMTDSRAFGYIFGSPDTGHRFFGIKTDKAASQVVIAMRDLFQVVFELKKKEIELAKQQLQDKSITSALSRHSSSAADSKIKGLASVGESSSSITKPDTSAEGGVAELVDLEQELCSLRRGLTQVEGLTPSTDPFGDSFVASQSQKGLLPPPPTSGSVTRGRNTPGSSRSLFSPNKNLAGLPFDLPTVAHDFDATSSNVTSSTALRNLGELVPPSTTSASSSLTYDVFTELDPLGTGRSKPYVDKKLFFQELKNPPKKVLKDLVPTTQSLLSDLPIVTTVESKTDQFMPTTTMTSLSRHSGGTVSIAKPSSGGTIFSGNFFSSDPFADADPFNSTDPFPDFKDDPFISMQEYPKNNIIRTDDMKSKRSRDMEKVESIDSGKSFNGPLQVTLPPEPVPKSPRLHRQTMDTKTVRQRPQAGSLTASPPPPLPPKKIEISIAKPPPRPPHDHDEEGPPLPAPQRKSEPMQADRSTKPRLSSAATNSSEDEYLAPAPPPLPSAKRFDITLSQLLTLSMDELAARLRVSSTMLSSMTLPQLTEYLRSYLAADNDRAHIHTEPAPSAKVETKTVPPVLSTTLEKPPPASISSANEFKAQFEDNFAPTDSAETFVANFEDFDKKVSSSSYDRYAVFREIQEQELKSSILAPADNETEEFKQELEDNEDLAPINNATQDQEQTKESLVIGSNPPKNIDELINLLKKTVSPKPTHIDAKIEDIKSMIKNLQIEQSRRSVSPREPTIDKKDEENNDRYAALREIIITEPPQDEFESLPPEIIPKERKRSDEKSDGFDNSDFFDCIDNSSLSISHVEDAFRKSPVVKSAEGEKKVEIKKEVPLDAPVKKPVQRLSTGSISDVVSGSSPDTKDKQIAVADRSAGRWSMLGGGWSSDSRDSPPAPPLPAPSWRRRHSPHDKRQPIVQTSSSSRDVSPWDEEPPHVSRRPPSRYHRDRDQDSRESRHNSSGSRECLDSGSGREKDKIRDKHVRDRERERRDSGSKRDSGSRRDSGSSHDRRDELREPREHIERRDRRSRDRDRETTWDRDRKYSREREYRGSRSRDRSIKAYREKDRDRLRQSRHSYDEDEDYSDGCGSGRSSPRERWNDRWRRDERNYGSLGWRESRRRGEPRQAEDPSDRRYGSTLGWPGRRSTGSSRRESDRDTGRESRDSGRDTGRESRDSGREFARDGRDPRRRSRKDERRPRDYRFSNDFSPRERDEASPFDNEYQHTPTNATKKRAPYASLEGTKFTFEAEEVTASPMSLSSARARDGDSPATRFRFDSDSVSPRSMFEDDFATISTPHPRTTSIAEEEEGDLPPLRTKPQNQHRDIKKSESINIFTRESDPFENDDFFACTGSDKVARRENWPGDFQGFENA